MAIVKDVSSAMSRNFKLLLYPDNEQHVQAVDKLKELFPDYLGILHKGIEGGKDHWHFAVSVGDVPMRGGTLARKLGLVTEQLEPDCQFIRLVGGRMSGFLIYLTHLNQPDKEQYSPSDLFGSSGMFAEYCKAASKYLRKEVDSQDCVLAVLDWLKWQEGIVRLSYFARWICGTPYFKCANSPLVRGLIQEHNDRIYNAVRKDYIDSVSDSSEKMQALLAYPESFDSNKLVLDPTEFEPLY